MTEDQGVVEAIARGRMGRRDPDCEAFADNLLRAIERSKTAS